jgi:hypothetical protein
VLGLLELIAIALGVTGVVAGIDWLLQKRSWKLDRVARNQQLWDQVDTVSNGGMTDARKYGRPS